MMIYIDTDYKCYTESAEGRTAIDTDYFDDKCQTFIEGYRFVPSGQTWTRADGVEFSGEMAAPWKAYSLLEAAQAQHEIDEAAHTVEIGELVDMIYENDMEVIG